MMTGFSGAGLQKDASLLKKFEQIHNYIYANDGLSPQQTLDEFVKILFIKIYDETNRKNLFRITPEEYAAIEAGNKCDAFIGRIEHLLADTKQIYKDVFDADERIRMTPATLGYVVGMLQHIAVSESSQDAKGLAFQKILSNRDKDGKGQFFTPEPIVDLCVRMINPQPDERILDPCCGSGGFLFSALTHLKKLNLDLTHIVSSQLYGLDINKSIAKISKMKFLLAANTRTNIHCVNSLEEINTIDRLFPDIGATAGFDVILTNPPFGTSGKITNSQILSQYDLGHKWIKTAAGYERTAALQNGQSAEVLFIERCLQLLKEGGRMAIILPNGYFENSSSEYLRYYIKQKARILSIVTLPAEAFIPFGTGVKTSILFLRKETVQKESDYPIYFGRVTKLGYQGNKNGTPVYKRDERGVFLTSDGALVPDEDFSLVHRHYVDFLHGKYLQAEHAYSIALNETKGRLDFDYYAPENRMLLDRLGRVNSVRLGDLVDIVKLKSPKLKNPDAVVDYVELSDISAYSSEIINSTSYVVRELPVRASYELKEHDIITAVAGTSLGTRKHATALVNKEFEGAICTNGFRVLRNPQIDSYYLLFFLRSKFFLRQILLYRTGAAIPNVSDADLANVLVCLPEQEVIEKISRRVQYAFELRRNSRLELEGLDKELLF